MSSYDEIHLFYSKELAEEVLYASAHMDNSIEDLRKNVFVLYNKKTRKAVIANGASTDRDDPDYKYYDYRGCARREDIVVLESPCGTNPNLKEILKNLSPKELKGILGAMNETDANRQSWLYLSQPKAQPVP